MDRILRSSVEVDTLEIIDEYTVARWGCQERGDRSPQDDYRRPEAFALLGRLRNAGTVMPAMRTRTAVRPYVALEPLHGGLFVGEHLEQLFHRKVLATEPSGTTRV